MTRRATGSFVPAFPSQPLRRTHLATGGGNIEDVIGPPPPPISDVDRRAASLTVCSWAHDVADARTMLAQLGLLGGAS